MSSQPNTPPISPKGKGSYITCKVHMLDDTIQLFHVPQKALGQVLFDEVVRRLQLLEADYFDLEFTSGIHCWLDREKLILKQMPSANLNFRFLVKFYTPDPGLLEDEFTRYLFALQIKRDLVSGSLHCQEHTAVLLASYVVQADLGDFIEDEYLDHMYLMEHRLLPQQSEALLVKVMEHHREHVGQSAAEADLNLLDTVRKVEFYGIRLHPAQDHEGVPLDLAVANMGVLVFQNKVKINTFSWAKIRKLSFKRRKFLIKLHPEGYGYYKDTVEFYFETRNGSKNFWKKCIEHHSFFRCHSVKRVQRNRTRVVSRGSSFRYSGRTQKQLVEFVRENYVKRPPFERSTSMRSIRTAHSTQHSTAATPKSGTLNSRKYRVGGAQSAESGSQSFDIQRSLDIATDDRRMAPPVLSSSGPEQNGRPPSYKCNDSMSRGDGNIIQHQKSEEEKMEDSLDVSAVKVNQLTVHSVQEQSTGVHHGTVLDPTLFMLSNEDRKHSAPLLNEDDDGVEGFPLARSNEVENIPEVVNDAPMPQERRLSLQRSQSATTGQTAMAASRLLQDVTAPYQAPPPYRSPDDEPPPPPPPYQGEIAHIVQISDYPPLSPPRSPSRSRQRGVVEDSILFPKTPQLASSSQERRERMAAVASRSTTSAASFTLTSSVTSSRDTDEMAAVTAAGDQEETRKKRGSGTTDRAYYIAKELLMTERTYKKDLEVITVYFKNAVSVGGALPQDVADSLFGNLEPIYKFHCVFLKEVEQRLAMWEGKANAQLSGNYHKIGDVISGNMNMLELYKKYMEHEEEIMQDLELATRRNKQLEQAYRDFEAQKVCHLPFTTFLLKPAQRLLHIKLILERLLKHCTKNHVEYDDCAAALEKLMEVVVPYSDKMKQMENLEKLTELQRDLIGVDNLVIPNRRFIREGCLQKLSRKGYQQRLFFLFSDMLMYTSRIAGPALQFKVHGQLPLRGMVVAEPDEKMAVVNGLTIYGGNKCLLVAAGSQEEKHKWLEDLQDAIAAIKDSKDTNRVLYPSLKSNGSSDNLEDVPEDMKSLSSPEHQMQHRANTTMHVCWHRNTSVSMRDHNIAARNQLSGYLLRKFKNSNGWQKLWVIFTNFCLFFYKTFQDECPLASLPLLGYAVTTPSEEDGIYKDFVFKLQFKTHVYFFRAESAYTFERWVEAVSTAACSRKASLESPNE